MNHLRHSHITQQELPSPTTIFYTTQGDLNQITPSTPINTLVQDKTQNQFLGTDNFFIPDGSNRHIHKIQDKVFHAGYLKNRNNAYLLDLD